MPKRKSKKSRVARQVKKRRSAPDFRRKIIKAIIKKPPRAKRPKFARPAKASYNQLRRAIKYLRSIGITKSRTRKKKQLRQVAEKYEDVLAGRSIVEEFSAKDVEGYRRSGYKTSGRKVIIPKEKGIRKRKRGRWIEQRRKVDFGEIIVLATPFSYVDLQTRLEELQTDKEVQKLLVKGWRLTIRYFGNYAYATMQNFDLLRQYLERYNLEQDDKKIQNLELMIILTSPGYNIPGEAERKARRAKYRRDNRGNTKGTYSARKYQSWKRHHPASYQRHKIAVKKAMRKYRRKLTRKIAVKKAMRKYRRKLTRKSGRTSKRKK